MRNFLTAAFFTLGLTLALEAEGLRKMTNGLNLNSNQRLQVSQILNSGNRQDPATRQRMQQQIMNVLDSNQRNQLAYQIQQQSIHNGYYNNGNYSNYTNGYNNGYYNNNGYNNGYNNNNYSNNYNNGNYNYNNGYNNGNSGLQNLINSGILNGVLQNLINR